jgi:hypothetical protein
MSLDRRTFVFLGPTLPVAEARTLLDAVYRPPVAMGDIYRLVQAILPADLSGKADSKRRRRPFRIAIIDGYFERMAAVWHKEILHALERGVEVYGASSMGALRAAELAPFGMIGVGRIAASYRSGELTDDDEVAVAHGPAERGYPQASVAMVNLRDGLGRARDRGLISGRSHDRLVRAAKGMFYRDRDWESLIAAGRAARVPARELAALATFVARARPDRKASDARTLLRRLASNRTAPAAARTRDWELSQTWFWHRFVEIVSDDPDGLDGPG